jgi:hypothetical protein
MTTAWTRGRQAWQLPKGDGGGGGNKNIIFNIITYLTRGKKFLINDVTGIKLMVKSFPWTVVLLAVSTMLQKPLISMM